MLQVRDLQSELLLCHLVHSNNGRSFPHEPPINIKSCHGKIFIQSEVRL